MRMMMSKMMINEEEDDVKNLFAESWPVSSYGGHLLSVLNAPNLAKGVIPVINIFVIILLISLISIFLVKTRSSSVTTTNGVRNE